MIRLKEKINLVTLTDQGLYDIRIRIQDFVIQEGFRYIDPIGDLDFNKAASDLVLKEAELAITPVSQVATRLRILGERDALVTLKTSLMTKDEGRCTCSLRYFAANEDAEIPLPIQGVTESFSCYVSELDEFPSMYDNVFLDKRFQMKQRVVKFLADTGFAGFNNESDFIIE